MKPFTLPSHLPKQSRRPPGHFLSKPALWREPGLFACPDLKRQIPGPEAAWLMPSVLPQTRPEKPERPRARAVRSISIYVRDLLAPDAGTPVFTYEGFRIGPACERSRRVSRETCGAQAWSSTDAGTQGTRPESQRGTHSMWTPSQLLIPKTWTRTVP